MFAILVNWIFKPILGVVLGQAAIHLAHLFGYYPERLLAEWVYGFMTQTPSPETIEAFQWGLAAVIGFGFIGSLEIVKARRARTSAKAALETVTSNEAEKWQIPIHEAITYLCKESEWGRVGIPEGGEGAMGAALILRQAALDQEIRIYGREEISRGSVPEFSDVWTAIPHDYWRAHEFDLPGILEAGARWQRAETRPENVNNLVAQSRSNYAALRVYKTELEARWPRTSSG